MDFKKILEQLDAVDSTVTKQTLSEAAFAKSGVKADAKKHKADATTRKQYFVKLTNAKGGNKGVTVMADEGESEGEVRSRVARDHKSQGWAVSSIREKGDAAEKAAAGEKKPAVTSSGKRLGRPPGSTKKVTEGRQTVSDYIAEARLMEKSMSPEQKGERERIVKGMKKVKGDFEKRYPGRGEAVMYATATKRAMKESQQGVAEGSLNEGQYEMMMRNGRVKKFIAKDDADAKRIAAGHGAKSVIKLRGGVPAGKIAEQGVAEGGYPEVDHMSGKRGIGLDSAKPRDTYVKTFHASKEKEAQEFAKKNGYIVKKHVYPKNANNSQPHEFQVHKNEQSVAEGAKQFSPGMHDRIKNATPQQLSQMATNFAGSDYDRYDHELELLKKAQKELQGVAEGALTYNRNYGHATQPEDGVQAKTREAAMELLNGTEPKSFEIDVKFPVREPGGLYKTSANGRFSAAIKSAGYSFGGLPGKSNEYGRVYSPKFNSGGSARASFSKVMDLIKQLGGILAGDRIVVYTDKYVGVTDKYVGHDPVDASLEKILPNSLQGVAEGGPTYDRKHSYFNQPEDGVQVKTHEAARDLFDVPGTKSFEIDVFFPAEPDRTRRESAAGKFRDAIAPTVQIRGGGTMRKPNSYQVGQAPGMSDEQYRVYSPTFSSPGVALASFSKVMDLIKRFGGTLTGDHIVVYTNKIGGRNSGDRVDTNLENLPKSSQSVSEGAKCNHTEEGEKCPVHGLDECGTYMEESQFDEDLNQMKKIAGVGAVAAAGLGAHISGENAEIRAKEVEKLEQQVAGEPNSVKRGQLEKMIKDIKAGKPLSRGDIISEVNPHHYDSDVDYYDAVEAEEARLRGDYDDAEEAHYADQADQKAYDDDMYEDSSDEAEYSDEVGMVENNLETIERAAEELDSILQQGEDLPEWVEEKVSNAKAMLVSAKEYMASQHANGDIHHVKDEEMEESNEFIGALAKARAAHKDSFEVDGKTYPVKESRSAVDELAECYDMAYQQAQAVPEQKSGMSVSANTSTEGTRSLTVNAEGDMADELAQLLSLSGLVGGHGHQEEMEESAAEEFHANTTPEPTTFSLSRQLNTGGDLNRPKTQHPAAAARGDNPLTR